jgi:transcriptional regulator with XRE-family HTH domain
MTIETLASKAEMDPTYLGSIERGAQNPTLRVLVRISEALGIEVTTLVASTIEDEDAEVLRAVVAKRLDSMDAVQMRLLLRLMDAIRL